MTVVEFRKLDRRRSLDARVPDRCDYKFGEDCFSDPKCLWDPPDESFSAVESTLIDTASSKICPAIAEAIVMARENDELEDFLTSEAVCQPFCIAGDALDCESFLYSGSLFFEKEAMSSDGDFENIIESELLLRRLKEVFESGTHLSLCRTFGVFSSGDLSEARRVLTSTPMPETFADYYETMMACEMCTECSKDPSQFSAEIRIFSHLDENKIQSICKAKFNPERGGCQSRCDPEILDPLDCYKEDDVCDCAFISFGEQSDSILIDNSVAEEAESPMTEMMDDEIAELEALEAFSNTQDVLCPHVYEILDSEEINTMCKAFVEMRTEYDESELETNPSAVCRGFCPVSGSCHRGFTEVVGLEGITLSATIETSTADEPEPSAESETVQTQSTQNESAPGCQVAQVQQNPDSYSETELDSDHDKRRRRLLGFPTYDADMFYSMPAYAYEDMEIAGRLEALFDGAPEVVS